MGYSTCIRRESECRWGEGPRDCKSMHRIQTTVVYTGAAICDGRACQKALQTPSGSLNVDFRPSLCPLLIPSIYLLFYATMLTSPHSR